MELINIGSWVIEIDIKRTKEFYQNSHLITDDCDCDFCVNYVLACDTFQQDIMDLFDELGIDPRKEGEVYEIMENEDGTHFYGGFYHLIGRIIDGPQLWIPTTKDSKVFTPQFEKLNGIEIGFTDNVSLVPDNFPKPVIQFEFQMNIPWLLS